MEGAWLINNLESNKTTDTKRLGARWQKRKRNAGEKELGDELKRMKGQKS